MTIPIASVQFHHHPGDKARNLERIERLCDSAAQQGAAVVAFPEMCITGYWHVRRLSDQQVRQLAEPVPGGPATQRLRRLAETHRCIVAAGLIEVADDGRLFNSYVLAHPDGRVDAHRKLHCFIHPAISSGDAYTVVDTHLGCKLGVLICYDNNIVENARITAMMGADILLAPHQTGGCDSKSPCAMGTIDPELWRNRHQDPEAIRAECFGPKGREWLLRWLPARAHDNGMFVVFSNGIGVDDDEVRTGNAMIIDCYGRIMAEAESVEDEIVHAEIDLGLLKNCTGRRWMRGRRPELYTPLGTPTGRELDPRAARFEENTA